VEAAKFMQALAVFPGRAAAAGFCKKSARHLESAGLLFMLEVNW